MFAQCRPVAVKFIHLLSLLHTVYKDVVSPKSVTLQIKNVLPHKAKAIFLKVLWFQCLKNCLQIRYLFTLVIAAEFSSLHSCMLLCYYIFYNLYNFLVAFHCDAGRHYKRERVTTTSKRGRVHTL
jgi:hypothetical protein